MPRNNYRLTVATVADAAAIAELMALSIAELQQGYLTPAQLEASKGGMGLDSQLIQDGTYFAVWDDATLVGCGGWSPRATLYGGNHSPGRDDRMLHPASERAKIRAMYTHPAHVHRGIGRLILDAGESAARAAGFLQVEMAASMAGKPFYLRCGYAIESEWLDEHGPVPVPLATMVKRL